MVAAGFAAGDGDTMKQLQAVLDTNIWLATHVVCVTMGYTASVLAGILAWLYVLRGMFDRSFAGEQSKDTSRMIYGIAASRCSSASSARSSAASGPISRGAGSGAGTRKKTARSWSSSGTH